MEREFLKRLHEWKERKDRKPLIVRGMRQVGKTWCVKEFAKREFGGDFVSLDFEQSATFSAIFKSDLIPVKMLADIEFVTQRKITPGRTLLFFDEVQHCPRALLALRYFYEQMPGLAVVAAGSLLDFELKDISFPVGRVSFLDLTPLSFTEFLQAEHGAAMAEAISGLPRALSEAVHETLLEEVSRYMMVGGMPKCVKTWVETNSFLSVRDEQKGILDSFRQDFSKYRPRVDPLALKEVFESVAQSIGSQLVYSRLSPDFSGTTAKKALGLLETARLFRVLHSVSPAGLPFRQNAVPRIKALMGDIGLMQAAAGKSGGETPESLLGTYRGALAEQFVGQEFVAANPEREVHWWSREVKNSTAEVDFLIESQGGIQPVEVKSGDGGSLKSLHQLLVEFPACRDGIVLSSALYSELPAQRLRFVPLYFAQKLGSRG